MIVMTEKERYDWDLNGIWDYNDESDEYIESYEDITKLLNKQEEELMMQREKALYWRNKAEDIWGDMKTNIGLQKENKKLKERIKELEQENKGIQEKDGEIS